MHTYDQSSGEWKHDGVLLGKGYSGSGEDKNNPAAEGVKGLGPIPVGEWHMIHVWNSPHTGPFTIVLEPLRGTDTLGRDSFRVHGDNIKNPGTASHGCIILPLAVRHAIWDTKDTYLTVIA